MRFFAIASIIFTAAAGVFSSPVEREHTQSVAAILTNLSGTVTPLAHQMLYATPENATKETLVPIVGGINTAVTSAVSQMKQLQGQSTGVIMSSDDTINIAALLADIVNLIFQASAAVLQVVDTTILSVVQGLLVALGEVVFGLLSITVTLVDGLLGPLITLLAPVLSIIISSLGLGSLLGALLGLL